MRIGPPSSESLSRGMIADAPDSSPSRVPAGDVFREQLRQGSRDLSGSITREGVATRFGKGGA